MANRLFRLESGLAECVVADPKAGAAPLAVTEIGDLGARVETTVEFQDNEYIDITLKLDGAGEHALFAQVVTSGDDGLHLRWLHFDPSEADRFRGVLDDFGAAKGLSAEEVSDEAPAPNKKKAKKRETRRVVRPRSGAASPEAGDGDNRKTRRVTKPKSDAADDAFGTPNPDAPAEPKRHETTSITPFGGSPQVSATPPGGNKRNTRRVSKPSPAKAGSDDDNPFEDSGENAVLAGTEQFKKLGDAKPAGPDQIKPKTVTIRKNVVGDDGKLDVGASIRSRAKTISAKDLAAKHDKVRVLNMSTIKELIQDAVQEALERLGGSIDAAEKEKLLKEAEEEFQERLKAFKAEKQGWEAQQKNLESQLDRAQRLLEEEKNKVVEADQFTVSEKGMEDLEKRFGRLVNQAIKSNGVSGPLADELQKMVSNLLDSERERIAEQASQAQSEAIKLLEKKVARLAGSLEESEKEASRAKRRAAALEAAGGGGGIGGQAIYSDFEDEEDKARKLDLLKVVFDQNKEMRDQLKKKGIKISGRQRPKPPPAEAAADVPSDEVEQDAPAPAPAAAPAEAEAPAASAAPVADVSANDPGDSDDGDDGGVDPDDMPWVPGTKLNTEIAGDNEVDDDDDDGVKRIAANTGFEPPSLSALKAKAGIATPEPSSADDTDSEQDSSTVEDGADDDMINPDDMPWQPGMKFTTDVAGDNEDDEDDNAVKKITTFKDIEPPPLQR